jgi:hypothetical protein
MFVAIRLAATCLFVGGLVAADPNPPSGALARILKPEEFAAAGLHKLSAAELASLEAALIRHGQLAAGKSIPPTKAIRSTAAASAEPAAKSGPADFGAEQIVAAKPAELTEALRSRISGTLDGFSGRAVFLLENGQIWQQRNPETVSFSRRLVNPEVVITRGAVGYLMLIVAADRLVLVKRVQ